MRPLAVTGLVGVGIPTRSATTSVGDDGETSVERHPHTLEWGFAVEYSLPYLQSFVQDVGLREPFNQMIPVVEFAMSTALDRGACGTTGTVNPGVIWAGRYAQLAVEAVIPVNNRSGNRVGWIAQLHFFLDDLFPATHRQAGLRALICETWLAVLAPRLAHRRLPCPRARACVPRACVAGCRQHGPRAAAAGEIVVHAGARAFVQHRAGPGRGWQARRPGGCAGRRVRPDACSPCRCRRLRPAGTR